MLGGGLGLCEFGNAEGLIGGDLGSVLSEISSILGLIEYHLYLKISESILSIVLEHFSTLIPAH